MEGGRMLQACIWLPRIWSALRSLLRIWGSGGWCSWTNLSYANSCESFWLRVIVDGSRWFHLDMGFERMAHQVSSGVLMVPVLERLLWDFFPEFEGLKTEIGNGQNTRFWLDTWLGTQPLMREFPSIFRLVSILRLLSLSTWRCMMGSWVGILF